MTCKKEDQPGLSPPQARALRNVMQRWAMELGFQQIGVTGIDLAEDEARFKDWLERQWHGEMAYMARHGNKRTRPSELVPGTIRVISVRMNYLADNAAESDDVLASPDLAYISRYALGRDYHRVLRGRLRRLARRLRAAAHYGDYRVFCDSAPVLEKPLARLAGLGWVGKHTLLINPKVGSWFFLGEIYTDIPLPVDQPFVEDHCGECQACIRVCPTKAIVGSRQLDARRCIAYLTIENKGAIPEPMRPLIGNRIYGCDDCQLVCPWNRYARQSAEPDFRVRHGLDAPSLVQLFSWSEREFLEKTEGMALRRVGYIGWLRNIAVALGNGPSTETVLEALRRRRDHPSELVREHVAWALSRHSDRL